MRPTEYIDADIVRPAQRAVGMGFLEILGALAAPIAANVGGGLLSSAGGILGNIFGGGGGNNNAPAASPIQQVAQVPPSTNIGDVLSGVGSIIAATRTQQLQPQAIRPAQPAAPQVIVTSQAAQQGQSAGIDTNTMLIVGGLVLAAVVLGRK